jgi:uncharacterized RDD family membrane protein YckC
MASEGRTVRDVSTYEPPSPTEGVLWRRVLSWLIDALICGALLMMLTVLLGFLGFVTLGLGWCFLHGLWLLPMVYTFVSVASAAQATPGQRAAGIKLLRDDDGGAPNEAQALVYAVGFWLTLAVPVLLLVALVTRQHRCLHDIAAGLMVVRAVS